MLPEPELFTRRNIEARKTFPAQSGITATYECSHPLFLPLGSDPMLALTFTLGNTLLI